MRRRAMQCLSLLLVVSAPLPAQEVGWLHLKGNGWRVDIPNGLTLLSEEQLDAVDRTVVERTRKRGELDPSSTLLFFATGKGGGTPFVSLTHIADSTATPTAFSRTTPERAMTLACEPPAHLLVISCDSGLIVQASGRAAYLSAFHRRVDGAEALTWNLMVPSVAGYYKLTITMTEDEERRTPAEPIWHSFAIDD